MISKAVEKAINKQIFNEEESSRIYQAMAVWCDAQGYPGAAKFLYRQTEEERFHMLKFIHYLNDRGGEVIVPELPKPKSDYKDLVDIFENVLKHEQFITGTINELYEITLKAKDYTTGNFVQWFIEEQIEEESTAQGILDQIRLVGDSKAGFFHIDKELGVMGEQPIEEGE